MLLHAIDSLERTFVRAAAILLLLLPAHVAMAGELAIVLYPGYGTAQHFTIEGRVIEARHETAEAAEDSYFTNLKRSARRLVNDEQANIKVRVAIDKHSWTARSDQEGYFLIDVVGLNLAPGWHQVEASSGSVHAKGRMLLVPPQNNIGLISDLDDTILISDVVQKTRLLKNTFLKNYVQRKAVPGAAAVYTRFAQQNVQPEAAPIFYLSASPRQLQTGIQNFLDHNGFPPGVLITKKVTNDNSGEPLFDQARYKTAHIERLLNEYPTMRFVLIGDDGERDPEIYHEIQRRFPARVSQVLIRYVSPDPARKRFYEQREFTPAVAMEIHP